MEHLSQSTIKQYSPVIVEWIKFCETENTCHFSAPISKIIDFLTNKFQRGAKYGTLNSAKAAIANILDYSIANNEIITAFFQGISRIRPSRPKYSRTWDVSIVLDHLSKWQPINQLNLEKLTKKLIVLLALVTAHRAQTLASINIENIIHRENKIEIEIPDNIKTSCYGKTQPLLILPYFQEKPELCVA